MNDLTDEWKKGELPNGWYWCKCYNKEIKPLYYDGDSFELDDPETKSYYFFLPKDTEKLTILALASYDELQNMNEVVNQAMSANTKLVEQNIQLKELLKEWVQFEIEENPLDFTVMSERISGLANKTKRILK